MTKKRKTEKQRARDLHARMPSLRFGEALALVRSGSTSTTPSIEDARRALQHVAASADVHPTWRERMRHHLVMAADPDWPAPQTALDFCADLCAAAGQPPLNEARLHLPFTMTDVPLPQLVHSITAMARAAGVRRYQTWSGIQPPASEQAPRESRGPWHQATQQYVFAAALAFAGPLHDLLQHPYGEVPPTGDVVYGLSRVAGRRSQCRIWTYTPLGLRVQPVAFPRPWGIEPVYGSYAVATSAGRAQVARALLADALGGSAPTAQASCPGCQGTGWLEALDDEHGAHRPHYRQDGRSRQLACLCGNCRGTGLRPLPAEEFARQFLTRPGPSWRMRRSDILHWMADHAPLVESTYWSCAPGLQIPYIDAVASCLEQAGFVIAEGEDGCGVDFDWRGDLGAWITLPAHGVAGPDGRPGSVLGWSSDRGWYVRPESDRSAPANQVWTSPLRVLCRGTLVPRPVDLVAELAHLDQVDRRDRWEPPMDLTADSYAELLAYHF
ncbi:hypothetical protein [Streptomyces sp. NPDC002553]|uniref:hypothetical protein n=1 Tax=Streptomyces sp. NPDC002553 TaxID=3154417 RepID=UPI00331DCC91